MLLRNLPRHVWTRAQELHSTKARLEQQYIHDCMQIDAHYGHEADSLTQRIEELLRNAVGEQKSHMKRRRNVLLGKLRTDHAAEKKKRASDHLVQCQRWRGELQRALQGLDVPGMHVSMSAQDLEQQDIILQHIIDCPDPAMTGHGHNMHGSMYGGAHGNMYTNHNNSNMHPGAYPGYAGPGYHGAYAGHVGGNGDSRDVYARESVANHSQGYGHVHVDCDDGRRGNGNDNGYVRQGGEWRDGPAYGSGGGQRPYAHLNAQGDRGGGSPRAYDVNASNYGMPDYAPDRSVVREGRGATYAGHSHDALHHGAHQAHAPEVHAQATSAASQQTSRGGVQAQAQEAKGAAVLDANIIAGECEDLLKQLEQEGI
jgi:hypothetical protein